MEELVENLSSDSFRTREKATAELWEMGEKAIEALRIASESGDPERSLRAELILEKVELRITPETPEIILKLIRQYGESNVNEKSDVLNELKKQKAYFQILKLCAMEPPKIREAIEPGIRGVAIRGAREAIIDGDEEAAIGLLELAATTNTDQMALACLYRNIGQLDAQLKNLNPPQGVSEAEWKVTLLRAKGDLAAASAVASESGQERLHAALEALRGDPTVWMSLNGISKQPNPANEIYVDAALERWKVGRLQKADFKVLLESADSRKRDEQYGAMAGLSSLGRLEEVERIQAKDDEEIGFEYYLLKEDVPAALELFGLDPGKPNYAEWAKKKFGALLAAKEDPENDRLNESPTLQLIQVASFMESRGLGEQLSGAYSEPLAELSAKSEKKYSEFFKGLFSIGGGAPEFGSRLAEKWAGEDEERWSEVYSQAFGREELVVEWLDWIDEVEPDISPSEKFKVALAIFRIGADPLKLRQDFLGKAWKLADESEERLAQVYVQRIKTLAVVQNDVATALRAYDFYGDPSEGWGSIDKFFSAAGRWKDAAELLQRRLGERPSVSPVFHAYVAATFRKAGMEEEAREHDMWAEKLALGFAPSCQLIGSYCLYAGDTGRAFSWFRRAAFQADVAVGGFTDVLEKYANACLQADDFATAASCYEVLIQTNVAEVSNRANWGRMAEMRLKADLARALAVLSTDRSKAMGLLELCHENFAMSGLLADDFFPKLREAGLIAELEKWFYASWGELTALLEKYPEYDNLLNKAGWFASRAQLELDTAQGFMESALGRYPDQPAFLDTFAEIHFAKGERQEAVKWSEHGLLFYPLTSGGYDEMIRLQHERFLNAPLPVRK